MGLTGIQIETLIAAILVCALIYIAVQRLPRTGGRNIRNHGIFVAVAASVILLLPLEVRIVLFSPVGIRVVGCIYPIYESIRAVCTPGADDDKTWLQYWISQGIVFYASEWVEDISTENETVYLYFYHFEFFFFLWLFLPYTDGADLIFDKITQPYLAPLLQPIVEKFDGWINMIISTAVSATHIWIIWAIFMFFPASLKRFITVSVGTIYPLLSSIIAVISPQTDDDTFWLTYWSCYGILFLVMDWAESFLGKIPGFYTVVICASIYLMVPIFNGADKFFRNVLVPLARQEEMLILHDAMKVKKDMMKKVSKSRSKNMKIQLMSIFSELSDGEDDDEEKGSLVPKASTDYQSIS